MEPGSTQQSIVLFILLLLSAFFSMSETALTTISKIRLKNMLEEGVKGAAQIQKAIENPKKLLSSILIGNNIVNILASSIATSIAIGLAGNNSKALGMSTLAITVLILVFSEITPKTMAAQNSEKVSLAVAKPINFCVWLMTPIVSVFSLMTGLLIKLLGGDVSKSLPSITEAELKTMVNVSHEEGVLEVDKKTMLNNVFAFGGFRAKDVMTPRTDIVAVPCEIEYDEVKKIFDEERFSRMPVYKDNTDNIIGILHLKDFIFADVDKNNFKIEEIMREPFFTYESKSTSELFAIMRTNRVNMAVILDEYGGTSGIVSLEDLIEEIVGDISDEDDEPELEIEVIKEDEYIVSGGVKLDDFNEMIGTRLESEDYESIGGYVMGLIGRIPASGDEIESFDVRFIVEAVDKNRIVKLKVFT